MFPEYRDLITRLKGEGTNHRFLHLFERHNELDHQIANMESRSGSSGSLCVCASSIICKRCSTRRR